jgi:RNA polymerase sigma factor (sigma-70 family)
VQQVRALRGHSPIKARESSAEQSNDAVAAQVLRALRGDAAAEEWIAERAYTAGLRLATFSLGDATLAQDVGQEVAIRVIRGLPKLRDAAKFDGWIYRICAAEIKRAANRRRRREHRELAEAVPELADEASFPRLLEDKDWLAQALAELSDRQRLVLGLRYVYGLEDEEIASAIGARRGSVRSLSSRAIARLRRRAEREDQAAPADGSRDRMEVTR